MANPNYEQYRETMRELDPNLTNVSDETLDIYIGLSISVIEAEGFTESDSVYDQLVVFLSMYYATSNSGMTNTTEKTVGDVEIKYSSNSNSQFGNKWLDAYERLLGSFGLIYQGIE